jgi:hypothetical protein
MPGRKRALTRIEAAKREEADKSRARRRAKKESRSKHIAEEALTQLKEEKLQYYNDIAEDYFARRHTTSPVSHFSLQLLNDSDDFVNIDDLLPSPTGPSLEKISQNLSGQGHFAEKLPVRNYLSARLRPYFFCM